MLTILYTLLVISGIFLIVMILLQAGKGAGAGLSIGGGMSQTMFGGSGGRSFFMKLTGVVAGVFMLLCLILAKMATTSGGQEYKGVMAGAAPAQAGVPAQAAAAAQPIAPAPAAAGPKK
jgi:preprotein translocase subunit SecG